MTNTEKTADCTPETDKPLRLIDYIDLLQKARGLSDQQLAEKIGLREARDLEPIRNGLVIPSVRILPNICLALDWHITGGLVAMSSDRSIDFNLNMAKAMEPFQVKDHQEVLDACDEVKSGKQSFAKISSSGVEVIIFPEK